MPGTSEPDRPDEDSLHAAIAAARCSDGRSLLDLSASTPVLAVFLRHSGCPFCVEALQDLAHQRRAIEAAGVRIVLVHMGGEAELAPFFNAHGVGDLPRISDEDQSLYRALGLRRGRFAQLAGPVVWWRVLFALRKGQRATKVRADRRQMPGVFLIVRGQVVASYRHRTQADRPDYCRIAGVSEAGN